MKKVLLSLALLLPASALHAEVRHLTNNRLDDAVIIPSGSLGERVCIYDDKRYSIGARIQTNQGELECAPVNEAETNGALGWRDVVIEYHIAPAPPSDGSLGPKVITTE